MKKKCKGTAGRALLYVAAGYAAYLFAQEIPAMIRYYKMTRL